jgi:Fe-S-cluster containining protein
VSSPEPDRPAAAGARPADPPSGSDLCTACGLCCTGLLFDIAPLEEREIPLADKLHLPLACNQYHDAFRLPCPCLRDKQCTIYTSRFEVCGSYECGLLRRYKAGEIALDEALFRVERAVRLADEVRRYVPAEAPPRPLWDEAREHLRRGDAAAPTEAWREERAAISATLVALRGACREGLDP